MLGLAVVALGLAAAFYEFALRPLYSQGDPRGCVRGVVVVAVFGLVGVLSRKRIDPSMPDSSPTRAWRAASTVDDLVIDCVARLDQFITRSGVEHVPLALHLGHSIVEVFWSGPPPDPPRPWTPRHPGWVWTADRTELSAGTAITLTSPALSALVAIGDTPTGSLWLNLTAFRVVELVGTRQDAVNFARTTIDDLRRRAADRLLDVIVVDGAEWSDMGIPTVDGDAAIVAMRRSLGTRPATRGSAPGRDATTEEVEGLPLIVVAPQEAPHALRRRLAASAREFPGVTYLAIGDVPRADLRLTCRGQAVRVPFLADLLVIRPSERDRCDDSPSPDRTSLVPTEPPPPHTGESSAPSVPGAGVVIQMLGPITVRGAKQDLTAKSTELLAYLACHPQGVHEDRIKEALWPTRVPRPQTWFNRVSATRRALGLSPEGTPLLLRFDRRLGRLHRAVSTDVDTLGRALSAAKRQDDDTATATLTKALNLVRGRPFDASAGYEWAFTELHVAHAERVVMDAAHHLAELALATDDWRRALWATEMGLRACPASEVLFQDRMRAYAAAGDRRGIDAALRDLRHTLAASDPSDEPSLDTTRLHARLRAPGPPLE